MSDRAAGFVPAAGAAVDAGGVAALAAPRFHVLMRGVAAGSVDFCFVGVLGVLLGLLKVVVGGFACFGITAREFGFPVVGGLSFLQRRRFSRFDRDGLARLRFVVIFIDLPIASVRELLPDVEQRVLHLEILGVFILSFLRVLFVADRAGPAPSRCCLWRLLRASPRSILCNRNS